MYQIAKVKNVQFNLADNHTAKQKKHATHCGVYAFSIRIVH